MGDRLLARANTMLMEKAARFPDLTPFESADFHDELRNAREGIGNRPAQVVHSTLFLTSFGASCLTVAAMLWHLEPLILLIVIAATAPSTRLSMRLFERMSQIFRGQATDARMLRYLALLATGDETAKEARLYGLGPYFSRRYRNTFERMFGELIPHVRRYSTRVPLVYLLEAAAIAVAYGMIVQRTIRGELTVGVDHPAAWDLVVLLVVDEVPGGVWQAVEIARRSAVDLSAQGARLITPVEAGAIREVSAPVADPVEELAECLLTFAAHDEVNRGVRHDVFGCDARVGSATDDLGLRQAAPHLARELVHAARLVGHGGEPDDVRAQRLQGVCGLFDAPTLNLHVEDVQVGVPALPSGGG